MAQVPEHPLNDRCQCNLCSRNPEDFIQDKGTDNTNAAVNQTQSSPSRIPTATNPTEQSSPETSQQNDNMNHASPSTQQPSPPTPSPIREARPQPAPTRQLFCQATTPTAPSAPVATAPSIATDPPQVQFMGYSIPQNLTPYQRFLLQQALQINHQPPSMTQNKLPVWPGAVTIVRRVWSTTIYQHWNRIQETRS